MGLYPIWSPSRPLHFLGHSIVRGVSTSIYENWLTRVVKKGGVTITKLQYLLSIGFFGNEGHPDMILSVTTGQSIYNW